MSDEPRAMTQEEIDALFASLTGSLPAVPKVAPKESEEAKEAAEAKEATAEKPADPSPQSQEAGPAINEAEALGQDDIDSLLQEMNGSDEPEQPESSTPPASAEAPQASMGQDDIDALLAEMNGGDEAAKDAPADKQEDDAAGPLGQDDIDALLAEMTGGDDSTDEATASVEKDGAAGPLSQDDIDALLAEMTGGDVAPVSDSVARSDSEQVRTNALSAEDIDNLVDKHADSVDDTEALISQGDIDALVRQMSEATGGATEKQEITDILNRRESDIEALLNEAAANVDTSDAVSDLSSFDRNPQAAASYAQMSGGMAPEELRGTRFLLTAAVFLLAMCAMAMIFVVSSINRLSGELSASRETVIAPTDDYTEDLRIAQAMLDDEDPVHAAKGVKLLERVRRRHRDVNREIEVTLILARHHHARSDYQRAINEFSTVAERYGTLVEDPLFYLEWARSYEALGRYSEARQTIGILIANEQRYLRGRDQQALDERTFHRHQRILRESYLLLGQLDLREVTGEDSFASLRQGDRP